MAETYVEIGKLRGPEGERGPRGDKGADGATGADGARGAEGPRGERGYPGTFHSVGATSIPAGEPASVEMTGDELYKHAQFYVPRGLPGTNGVANDEAFATYFAVPDSLTRAAADPVIAAGAEAVAVPRMPLGRLIPDDPAAAAQNAAVIQAALDSAFHKAKVVHLPAGLFYITSIRVPEYRHLTGEYARSYTDMPEDGTRLRCPDKTQTAPVVSMTKRSMLTKIGVYGASTDAAHAVIKLELNGPVIREAEIGYGRIGIDANYHLLHAFNVHIFGTGARGISDVLDGRVHYCTINANAGVGIYGGTGANATQYVGNRVEWNDGGGYSFYQAHNVSIIGGIIDRNGKAGIREVFCQNFVISGPQLWRNGRYSEGVADDDVQVYLQGGSITWTGATTKAGVNDDGTGYRSPAAAVRVSGAPKGVITGNDFTGTTGAGWSRVTGTDESGLIRHSNVLPAGETETFIGASYVGEATIASLAGNSQGTAKFTLPAVGTFSTGRVYRIQIAARDHESSTATACVIDVLVSRSLSADARIDGTLTNIVGSAFGLGAGNGFYQVTLSVDATGSTLLVQVYSSSSTVRSFSVRVQ